MPDWGPQQEWKFSSLNLQSTTFIQGWRGPGGEWERRKRKGPGKESHCHKRQPDSNSFHEKHPTCATVGDTNITHRPGRKAAPNTDTSAVSRRTQNNKKFFKTSKATGTEI